MSKTEWFVERVESSDFESTYYENDEYEEIVRQIAQDIILRIGGKKR